MNANHTSLLKDAIKALESWGRYGEAMKEFGRGHDGTSAALGTSNEYFIGCLRAALDDRTGAAVKQSLDWQAEARAKAARMEAELEADRAEKVKTAELIQEAELILTRIESERPEDGVPIASTSPLCLAAYRMPNGSKFVTLIDDTDETWEAYCREVAKKNWDGHNQCKRSIEAIEHGRALSSTPGSREAVTKLHDAPHAALRAVATFNHATNQWCVQVVEQGPSPILEYYSTEAEAKERASKFNRESGD